MKYCCCAAPENYDLVKKAGYERITFQASYVATCSEEEFENLCALVAQDGPKCRSLNAFCPASIPLVGLGHDPKELRKYTQHLGKRAALLGVEAVGIGSPNSRKLPEGYDRNLAMTQWEQSLKVIAEELEKFDIFALAEPLCTLECNWMNTTEEVLSSVKKLNLPNLGMVFDMYHAFAMGEDAKPMEAAMPYVRLVHIAQLVEGEKHYLRPDHREDCAAYFAVLRAWGYDGELAVEATYDPLEEALPRSLEILRDYENA